MSTTPDPPIIIVGAGPAGLAVAGLLSERGIPIMLLEKGEGVGAAWRRHYDRLHLHTVKEQSHLPGAPFPNDYPRYVPRQGLVDYYEDYADRHALQPHLGCEADDISRVDGRWRVQCTNGETYTAPYVVLATGMNRVPYQPWLEGREDYSGQILHSGRYRNAEPFKGLRVLVVGFGNSGAEIALDLAENGVDTFLSVRGPVNVVPRDFLGRPTQLSALMLAKLPPWLANRLGLLIRRLTVGDLPKYGLQLSDLSPAQQSREIGQTPVLDLGTVDAIRAGRIKVFPAIDHLHETGAVFKNGEEHDFDALILATGFRAKLDDLLDTTEGLVDEKGLPKTIIGEGPYAGLYFVGFDNRGPRGTLGIIREEAAMVVRDLMEKIEN